MIRESLSRNFILVLVCTFIVFLVVIVLYVQDQIKIQTEIIESERLITVNQIASRTELRVNNAIVTLEILSKNPHIVNPPSITLIDEKIHGIPEDTDVNRRNAMRDTFDYYGGFQNMLFLLPNGDVYINEPFFFQKNMTVSNFAFRDWYKETIDTKDVVVSNVVVSKSSDKPNVVIAVPVFSQDESFQGILTGSLSLDIIEEKLEELKSYTNERILIVDNTRTAVADSEHILKGQSITFGADAIEDSFSDKRGIFIDTINGTKMVVAYHPIKVGQNTWAIISIESYDDAFSAINKTIEGSLFLITLVIVISSTSLFTVNRYFRIQFKLRKQAEDANTELVKTQNYLLKSEEKYKNLYHLSPDAIVVFDKSGTIISYNESFARLFGYSLGELNGKSVFAIVSDSYLDLAHSYFDEIQKIGTIENKENWLKKKNETVFPSLFSVSTVYNDRIEYICIIKDISEIHNMQENLKEAINTIQEQLDKIKEIDKTKDEFSAMVTHELKTPLMPIMWHCNLLKKDMVGVLNAEQLESIESIEKNAKQLELLISDIMDARKLDLNKMKFNLESISLDEFFSNLDHAYKNALADKGVSFKTRYPSGVTIRTDKTRLRQVFDNLIGNSIKFVPQDTGIIEIIAEKKENELAISIKDNGQGIPLEKQKGLFQKFYQVDTSERRKISGTGLGLAISKGITKGLGGSIRLESDGKTGTTIHISLPIENQNS